MYRSRQSRVTTDPRVIVVVNPDPSRGMFSSIQTGVSAAEGDPILVLPGDMPFVRSETVAALVAAARLGEIVSPRYGSKHGHPDRAARPSPQGDPERRSHIDAGEGPRAVRRVIGWISRSTIPEY